MMRVRRAVVLAAGMAVSLAMAPAAPGAPGGTHSDHHHEVSLRHERFDPATVEVAVGEEVIWIHRDGNHPQSVTADDGSFDSHPNCSKENPRRCMRGGERFRHTFTKTGRYPYHSRIEGGSGGRGMSGVVVVVEEHEHQH